MTYLVCRNKMMRKQTLIPTPTTIPKRKPLKPQTPMKTTPPLAPSPQLASTPPTRVEALNTKIKMENLSSYATVKIENSDGTKDRGPGRPGARCLESLLKKTPRRSSLRTFRPVELYSAREESLKREVSLSLALCVCIKF